MAFDAAPPSNETRSPARPERVDVQQQFKEAVEKDASKLEQLKAFPDDVLAESYAQVLRDYEERSQTVEAKILRGFGQELGLEDYRVADPVAHVSSRKRLLG